MKLPPALLNTLSPLVEAARGEPLVAPFIDIAEFNEQRLVLVSPYGRFCFDRVNRQVLKDDTPVCAFGDIRSIDLAGFPGGRGAPSWTVTLYCGFTRRTTVGRTYDDGEASVTGARLARLIGCKVVSLVGHRR